MNESISQARDAVRKYCEADTNLTHQLHNTVDDGDLRPVKKCPKCGGKYHYCGRTILPDGALGWGGLAIYSGCGHNEKVRY